MTQARPEMMELMGETSINMPVYDDGPAIRIALEFSE